jgi:hypothetical protein
MPAHPARPGNGSVAACQQIHRHILSGKQPAGTPTGLLRQNDLIRATPLTKNRIGATRQIEADIAHWPRTSQSR